MESRNLKQQGLPVSPPEFRQPRLLEQALTHKSYVGEHPEAELDNERLEFLGDAILNFLSGELLFQRFPELPEGELTPLRSFLVDKAQLATFAEMLDLGSYLRLGRGVEKDGGRQNPRLLSSAFEALIGAYFLDQDADVGAVRDYVEPFFYQALDQRGSQQTLNAKSRFQEWALAQGNTLPEYCIIGAAGPDHAKHFVAEVLIDGVVYGEGNGPKKQAAEKAAAHNALERLGLL
ncbi:ribonuclease III [filamentous cyanobacterium CCP5]|nr:ribonuclease III [filamentous cyanobacterium CCP5]